MGESTEVEKSIEGQSEQSSGVEPTADEPREWETDSSPIESSSDDSSSDDSSDEESEDGDNTFKLLTPQEQAKILMEGDGGSDDEGGNKGKGTGGQLRTKNEIPEVVIPKPDVTITEAMPIEELGNVEAIVENIVLVKGKTTGEYRVLESGSVLCLADRSVIGVVSEPLGRVQQPLYSVLFTNATEIAEAKLEVGTTVFYSEQHSTYVFTQALKAYKGSDASNLHDEEVGDDEMEFSDDEAEAEHKRRVKQAKRGRGGKPQQNGGSGRGGHPLQQQHTPYDASKGLSYDDADDDGPYKPLTRPAGFADSVGRSEPPEEGAYQGGANGNNHNQSRDNFRGRGRGDRGRGRGDRGRGERGRGRGGFQDRRGGGSSGYSLPPQSQPSFSPPQANGQSYPPPFQQPGGGFSQPPQAGFNNTQYSPQQPQLPAWPPFPTQPPFQQSFPGMPNIPPAMQNMWQNMYNQAPQQGGAFINPAFFNNPQGGAPNQWNPQGQQRGRGRGSS
jgi:H/ACA ribonucleoprotein complex non-core subunit NAF1